MLNSELTQKYFHNSHKRSELSQYRAAHSAMMPLTKQAKVLPTNSTGGIVIPLRPLGFPDCVDPFEEAFLPVAFDE